MTFSLSFSHCNFGFQWTTLPTFGPSSWLKVGTSFSLPIVITCLLSEDGEGEGWWWSTVGAYPGDSVSFSEAKQQQQVFSSTTPLSSLHFVSQLMELVFSSSWLGKTRLPSPWCPRRKRSCSQQSRRRWRINSCHPASGISPDTGTQVMHLQALQPFSRFISGLEISSGEPKWTCWLLHFLNQYSDTS